MKEMVLKLLPEIKQIKDHKLQDKVIACWREALEYRKWTAAELERIPFTLLAENVRINFIEHVRTCTRLVIAVDKVLDEAYAQRKTAVNRDYLIAGALLADVGKLFEFDKKSDGTVFKSTYGMYLRHPFTGVGLGYKYGLPAEVLHIIAVHSKEGDSEKRSAEAIIFHHVDFIDFELVK
jgi:hypothetical protein